MKKVLVIDDNEETRELLYLGMIHIGARPILASDGREGLELARKESPDLIITDMAMPVQDGFSTLATLKSEAGLSKIPVVVITSKGIMESFIAKNQSIKIEAFFEKPFEVDVLLDKVQELLGI
ncbi:MAG: response regulator [Endomicrobiia bacterium]|nr:response regulator [Endomicrobiia bacterium]